MSFEDLHNKPIVPLKKNKKERKSTFCCCFCSSYHLIIQQPTQDHMWESMCVRLSPIFSTGISWKNNLLKWVAMQKNKREILLLWWNWLFNQCVSNLMFKMKKIQSRTPMWTFSHSIFMQTACSPEIIGGFLQFEGESAIIKMIHYASISLCF